MPAYEANSSNSSVADFDVVTNISYSSVVPIQETRRKKKQQTKVPIVSGTCNGRLTLNRSLPKKQYASHLKLRGLSKQSIKSIKALGTPCFLNGPHKEHLEFMNEFLDDKLFKRLEHKAFLGCFANMKVLRDNEKDLENETDEHINGQDHEVVDLEQTKRKSSSQVSESSPFKKFKTVTSEQSSLAHRTFQDLEQTKRKTSKDMPESNIYKKQKTATQVETSSSIPRRIETDINVSSYPTFSGLTGTRIYAIQKPYHIGFDNPCNWCYMNSSVQALLGQQEFIDKLLYDVNKEPLEYDENDVNMCLTLIRVYQSRQKLTEFDKATMDTFRQFFVTKVYEPFNNNQQQDASEFLFQFIAKAHDELPQTSEIFYMQYEENFQCENRCGNSTESQSEKTKTNILYLNMGNKRQTIEEILDSQTVTCKTCNQQDIPCTFKFTEVPRVLILHLKRYTREGDVIMKNNTPVDPSARLKIYRKGNLNVNTMYDLSAVIVHSGESTNRGHYYAFVKHDDIWFQYNDDKVYRHDNMTTLTIEDGYIFFYKISTQ